MAKKRITYCYWVERHSDITGWQRMCGSCDNKSFATGWYHALLGFYPRPAYRLVKAIGLNGEITVLEESSLNRGVHV